MTALEIFKMIPWKIVAPIIMAVVIFFTLFGFRGCAAISQAINRGEYEKVRNILLSPGSDYDELLLRDPGK